MNAPPWHQNMTGLLRPSLTAGVQTLSTRQFSLIGGTARPANSLTSAGLRPNALSSCIARLPNSNASRTPVHGFSCRGARKRPAPSGDSAYGMPLKMLTPLSAVPRIFPQLVSTSTCCAICRIPPRPSIARSKLLRRCKRCSKVGRLLFVRDNVVANERPRLRARRPNLRDRPEPTGVVERTGANVQRRRAFSLRIDARVARCADLRHTLRSARDESFCRNRIACNQFESSGRNHDRHAKRAAGPLLTWRAVANVGGERRLSYKLADFVAGAAARVRKRGLQPAGIADQLTGTGPRPPT